MGEEVPASLGASCLEAILPPAPSPPMVMLLAGKQEQKLSQESPAGSEQRGSIQSSALPYRGVRHRAQRPLCVPALRHVQRQASCRQGHNKSFIETTGTVQTKLRNALEAKTRTGKVPGR